MPTPAVIRLDIDPVLHLAGIGVHWYGVAYAVAFFVGLRYGVVPFLEKRGIPRAESERMCFWVIVVGLLGARLYYVVQSSPPQGGSWFAHPVEIIAVWHGGMAFFGAIAASVATIAVLAWQRGHNFWLVADAGAIFGVLGQPIGRLGNIVNGDILGSRSDLPWATAYANANAILQRGFCHADGDAFVAGCTPGQTYAYQPAALYELLGTVAIGLVLLVLLRRGNPRPGTLILVYLALYALSQFLLFYLRNSEPTVLGPLKQAQVTALVVGLVAVPIMVLLRDRPPAVLERLRRPASPGSPSRRAEEAR